MASVGLHREEGRTFRALRMSVMTMLIRVAPATNSASASQGAMQPLNERLEVSRTLSYAIDSGDSAPQVSCLQETKLTLDYKC
jgi:hypothetical protein